MKDYLFGVYAFIVGSVFASFFGVIINRVPNNKSIIFPPSSCDNCGHKLKWYENIPVLSYIFLGGKCSKCKTNIGYFSFVFELICGFAVLIIYIICGRSIYTILFTLITLVLLLIGGYDYKTYIVKDSFLIILFFSCLALMFYRTFVLKMSIISYIVSFLVSTSFFVILRFAMNKILNKDSLGIGDIYVISIMSFVLKPFELVLSILIASLCGLLLIGFKSFNNSSIKDTEIAFCPYLCFGFYVMMLFGNNIIEIFF